MGMDLVWRRTRVAALGLAMLGAALGAREAGAAPLLIEQAVVDPSTQTLIIEGEGFGSGTPVVTLGTETLTVLSSTTTEIVAAMPTLPPGAYRLKVSKGTGDDKNDSFRLELGYARLDTENTFLDHQRLGQGLSVDGLVPETNNTIHAQTAEPTAFVIDALSLSTTGQTRGVNATTFSDQSSAVVGSAQPANGQGGTGGAFDTYGTGGVGVWTAAQATTGGSKGIQAQVYSAEGVAGWFQNVPGGQVLSGNNGTGEVFRVEGDGTVRASAFTDLAGTPVGGGVSQVDTGFGLSGGPITGSGTIQVDVAALDTQYARLHGGNLLFDLQDMVGGLVVGGVVPNSNNTIHAQSDTGDAFVVSALSLSPTGQTRALTGTTLSEQSIAVAGIAWPQNGLGGIGGSFETNGEGGVGAIAFSAAGTGTGHGLNVLVNSPDGVAGWFLNQASGQLLSGNTPAGEVFRVEGDGTVRASAFTDLAGTPVGGGVSQVDTGFGLSGGPITGSGTIEVDTGALDTHYARIHGGNQLFDLQDMVGGLIVSGQAGDSNTTLIAQSDTDDAFVVSALSLSPAGQTRALTGTTLSEQSIAVVGAALPENGLGGNGGSFISTGEGGVGAIAESRAPVGTGHGLNVLVGSPDGVAGWFLNEASGQILSGNVPGQEVFRVDGDGTVTAFAYVNGSSRRYKANVVDLDGGLAAVARLRGVSFDWKETGRHDIGFIAEEVAAVVPEVVAFDDRGAQGIDYARLTTLLVEAIQEQQAEIDELRERLEARR